MKLVLLSGGSGKRLWPISNDSKSKQFIKVLYNEQDNQYESMVQRVWRQINEANLQSDTLIISNEQQREILDSQIPQANKIYEPSRKDTFPAIALACLYLKDVVNISSDEEIIISPVDPYVTTEYFEKMKKLPLILSDEIQLSLMGVSPREASEKFGYIVRGSDEIKQIKKVEKFVEKPNEHLAKELIKEGALWNCGVFCFKLKTIIEILEERNLPTEYESFFENYNHLVGNSFDYEVVERMNNVSVLEFDGLWKDLGTWSSLSEEINSNIIGDAFLDSSSINTTIINELSIPIIGMELRNLIIAASPEGILISEKEMSDNLKKNLSQSNLSEIIMYEDRRWGNYKVLDYSKNTEGQEVITKRLLIEVGKSISYQYHTYREETWTIIKGRARVVIEDQVIDLNSGETITINKGQKHYIEAITEVELIEIQSGKIKKEDVVRFNKPYVLN